MCQSSVDVAYLCVTKLLVQHDTLALIDCNLHIFTNG